MTQRVLIVGGGITGLSCAWYLEEEARRRGADVSCTLVERDARLGGKILTRRIAHESGDFLVEEGADSFLTFMKPWAMQVAGEIGLGDRLIGTNDDARRVLVLRGHRLHPLPEGVVLIVPTRFWPFVRSGLLSPLGKLRAGFDLVLPRRRDEADETLADFVSRRLGEQVLDRIAEPLLSGIFNSDAARQSLLATLPRLRQMEIEHRSLILAALRARRRRESGRRRSGVAGPAVQGDGQSGGGDEGGTGRPLPPVGGSVFASFAAGTQELPDGLAERTAAEIRSRTEARRLTRGGSGWRLAVRSTGGSSAPAGEEELQADAVVLCAPVADASRLLADVAPSAGKLVGSIRSVSTGTISLAYAGDVLPPSARGFGLVIPTPERRPINAVTYSSVKLAGRAPDGTTLLRVFFGGSRSPATLALSDEEALGVARSQLRELLGIAATPLFWHASRWIDGQPQYDLGHLDLVRRIEEALPSGLWVAGSAYRGVGIPDCVRQGRETAEAVVAWLAASPARRGDGRRRLVT